MVNLTDRIIGAESSGNPLARNPRSSAGGLGQFIDSTFLATLKKHRPDLAASKSDAELLRLKFDPALSREMTSAYASDNQNFLRSRGLPTDDKSTYLAHFAGPGGAAAVLSNPQASAEASLGRGAIAANPFLRNMTGADVINWAGGKVDPAKTMAANLRERFGTKTEGGVTAPAPAQEVSGATERLKAALRKYDQDWIDTGKGLQKRGQEIATSYGNRLGAYGGAGVAALGGFLEGMEGADKKAHDEEFSRLAGDASDTTGLMNVMLSSSDPKMREAGIELKAKLLTPKVEAPIEINGRLVQRQSDGSYKEVYAAPASTTAKLGLHPQQYIDKDGNLVYTQVSESGGRKDIDLPEGARWAPGYEIKDTGTALTGINKRTGEVGPVVPKDVAGKEAAEERGKLAGQAQVALPASKSTLDNAFQTIGDLRKHPGLETGTGGSNVFDPRSWMPGTNAYDFIAKNKQAQGQSFMAARDALKGAGQVTDFEGTKGEQAISNLDAAQSKEQYLDALDTLEKMMRTSYDDMQRKAGMADQPRSVRTETINPQTGQPDQPSPGGPARIQSQQEYQALPPGTQYLAPDGSIRTKQ